MGIIFIVFMETVLQCMGFRWCEQYSYISFRHLFMNGSLELMIEVPVFLLSGRVFAKLKVYRRKQDKINND